MESVFLGFYNYYYLVLILQAVCVFHAYKRGNHQKWIWIIVFLPFIGSLVYIFTEIIKRRHVSQIQDKVSSIVNPGGHIAGLEKQFRFSNTFTNRVALADAYFEQGMTEKAIELYEGGLSGVFKDNEHVLKQLVHAYYNVGRFDDVIRIGPLIKNSMNFSTTRTNLFYALALEKTGQMKELEREYKAMNHRYSNYEARFSYGMFLLNQQRREEAAIIFNDIVEEGQNMNRREKGENATWISKASLELNGIMKQ